MRITHARRFMQLARLCDGKRCEQRNNRTHMDYGTKSKPDHFSHPLKR
jgi:hypothetical protein